MSILSCQKKWHPSIPSLLKIAHSSPLHLFSHLSTSPPFLSHFPADWWTEILQTFKVKWLYWDKATMYFYIFFLQADAVTGCSAKCWCEILSGQESSYSMCRLWWLTTRKTVSCCCLWTIDCSNLGQRPSSTGPSLSRHLPAVCAQVVSIPVFLLTLT